ncbi:hypothetical protein KC644_00300 [Candidatus Berkelbacteria bacterium]|nr:hypothetical protein [Candidatus Berkelbacteria bacterium]
MIKKVIFSERVLYVNGILDQDVEPLLDELRSLGVQSAILFDDRRGLDQLVNLIPYLSAGFRIISDYQNQDAALEDFFACSGLENHPFRLAIIDSQGRHDCLDWALASKVEAILLHRSKDEPRLKRGVKLITSLKGALYELIDDLGKVKRILGRFDRVLV